MDETKSSGRSGGLGWIIAIMALAVAAGWWWMQRKQTEMEPAVVLPGAVTGAGPASAAEPEPQLVAEPKIQHPIDDAGGDTRDLPQVGTDPQKAVVTALNSLLGRPAVLKFLVTEGFIQRVVATVDNLPRSHAPTRVWPLNPTPGSFQTQAAPQGGTQVAPANAARYAPLVKMVAGVDAARAVGVYKQLYPAFQKAYEELGYPQHYFNDRLIEVIDHLVATPEPTGPLALRLTEVKGPYAVQKPWTHYAYADPSLEARSSGQKVLMRMGPEAARPVKAKLAEIRRLLAGPQKP